MFPREVEKKLKMLEALAWKYGFKNVHFWKAHGSGVNASLGSFAFMTSEPPSSEKYICKKLVSFSPERRRSLSFVEIPTKIAIDELVRFWTSYSGIADLACSLVDKILEICENGCDVFGRYASGLDDEVARINEEDRFYGDIVFVSGSGGESLEKMVVEMDLAREN